MRLGKNMGLGKRLVLLAGTLAVFNFVLWVIPTIAPKVPDRYEGVSAAAPPSQTERSTPSSSAPPLPPGFPSMERPPPKIEVPEGQPQPIATKFGLTYDVPAGWDVWRTGVAGWTGDDGTSAIYGALGFYDRTECKDGEYSELALTGMTGRRTENLDATALAEVNKATMMFSGADESIKPSVTITGPLGFSVGDRRSVRYRATVENTPETEENCESTKATFDVVATPAYATAEVAVFVLIADRDVDDALTDSAIDAIIASIRKS